MALTVDTTTSQDNSTTSSSTVTWTHVNHADADLIVVAIPCSQGDAAVSVTYNGDALTLAKKGTATSWSSGTSEIWYKVNPATGSNTMVITHTSSKAYYYGSAISFIGADTSDPIGADNSATGDVQNKSVTLTTEQGDSYVVDCLASQGNVQTPDGTQTDFSAVSGNRMCSYKDADTQGENGTSWTAAASNNHILIIVEIRSATPPATGINIQVNISDVWKEGSAAKINISDDWKEVVGIQQNIGDTWKTVF